MGLEWIAGKIAWLIAIIIALALHEFGHAAMSTKLGDPTPRLQGRLTLNPVAHLDPMGTLFIMLTVFSGFGIGWGKPVITNPLYYNNYRQGMILTAVAGPAMNLVQASFALAAGYALFLSGVQLAGWFGTLFSAYIFVNLGLMLFNLLPLPMLDGGHVLANLLPMQARESFYRLSPYGLLIVLALMWMGILGRVLGFLFQTIVWIIGAGFGPDYVSFILSGILR